VNPIRDITIIGAGPDATILDGNAASPVVMVEDGRNVTLNELRIEGAAGDQDNGLPGGVVNAGSLTMTNCVVAGNTASSTGGGIRNDNQLTMTGCMISNNSTDDVSFGGGGIYNVGASLTMHNCIVEGNSSGASGGGILVEAGNVTLDGDCRVRHNAATSDGGGIYRNLGTVTIEGSSPANVVTENCPNNCGSPSTIAGCSGGASACP
jgi:hypothetical protein